jgi:hypothetical protein
MNILQAARRLERLEALDNVAKPLAGAVGRAVRPRVVRTCSAAPTWGIPCSCPGSPSSRPAGRPARMR